MDEHQPKARDISENAAKAGSAATNAKAALDQSNRNTHEPQREAGDMLAGAKNAASDAVEPLKVAQWRRILANMRRTGPPRQPRRCSDRQVARAIAYRISPQPIR
jgi:hypothetical protein